MISTKYGSDRLTAIQEVEGEIQNIDLIPNDATVVTLPLDPGLKPGRYFYKSIIYSACDDANYTKEVGPAPFVISPATQAN